MTARDDRYARALERRALTMRMDVYGRNPATGRPDALLRGGIRCLLTPANIQAAPTSGQRAELASSADLRWERGYDLPNGTQIAVDKHPGWRFTVRDNTQWRILGPDGGPIANRCQLTRIRPS